VTKKTVVTFEKKGAGLSGVHQRVPCMKIKCFDWGTSFPEVGNTSKKICQKWKEFA
jgi:hypothetical protein